MTHTQLIKQIAKKIDLTPEEAAILWQQTSHILMKELAQHQKIRIKNFGAFVTVKHKSRTVPDPREMSKKLVIFDQFLPKFRPSEQLKQQVKQVIPSQTEEPDQAEAHKAVETVVVDDQERKTAKATKTKTSTDKTTAQPPQSNGTLFGKAVDIGYADLSNLRVDSSVLELIPYRVAKKNQIVPLEKKGHTLTVAMTDPGDLEAIELVARQTGFKVKPKITTSSDLQHVLDQYNTGSELDTIVSDSDETLSVSKEELNTVEESDAPAAKVITNLLERAVREKASDVHIEPEEKKIIVRFRIDGMLQQISELPKNIQASLISRLKILSNLKIDETRLPQDGRLRLIIDNKEIDFRLSTLPTVTGEKVVMRILDKSAGILAFKELGLDGVNLQRIEDNITKSHGMILVTGPTGSGKTTTLYSVIGRLMDPSVNIVTLEDPVEYRIPGINQSQVNPAISFDFASGMRTIVRQDPDVILIGEIRDLETATMAIHAALTGHVVLSTLHTNDSAGAIPRLIDMGIEPFLITSSTNAIVAQRLVRRLCQHCKTKLKLPEEALTETRQEIESLPKELRAQANKLTFYQGKGCAQCNKSGYSGRLAIFEVLPMSESIKQLALKRVSSTELAQQAKSEGMISLKQDGILKALAGETTLEEVWRVTKD